MTDGNAAAMNNSPITQHSVYGLFPSQSMPTSIESHANDRYLRRHQPSLQGSQTQFEAEFRQFCELDLAQTITGDNPALNQLLGLVAEICQTPIALVSLVGATQQWQSWIVDRKTAIKRQFELNLPFYHYTIQQSQILVVQDLLADSRFAHCPLIMDGFQIRFYAGIPLVSAEGCILGVLGVLDQRSRQLSRRQIKALQTLGDQVIDHIILQQNNAKLKELSQQLNETKFQQQQQTILFQLASQIRNSLDLNTVLQTTVDQVHQLLHIDRCQFLWCLPNGNHFSFAITHEAKAADLPSALMELSEPETVLSKIVPALQILKVENVLNSPQLSLESQELLMRSGIVAQLSLPLKTQSGQIGAIVCSHYSPRSWLDSEVHLLQAVTDQLAIAIEQSELFSQVRANALVAQTQAQYLTEAMQTLQKTQAQLIQHEKMSSLGQLVAGVAHEINNPVNFISGNICHATNYVNDLLDLLKLYQQSYPEFNPVIQEKIAEIELEFLTDDLPKSLASMQMGAERIRQIVLSLRNFSRLDEAEIKPVDIHEGIDNTLLILQSRLKSNQPGKAIQIIKEYENLPLVECYAGQLNQVFMNLIGNAIDALENVPDPKITIATQVISCPYPKTDSDSETNPCIPTVSISIRDNGCGMTEAVQQKLFNPFFTTKPVGKGTGLGLSISYQIVVEKHNGALRCLSTTETGTEFQIRIPIQANMS